MRKKQRFAAEPGEEAISPGRDTHEAVLQLVQGFATDDWQGKKVYLYRVWPVIDKKSDDHFIAKLSETFDEDYLLKNWGSGRSKRSLEGAENRRKRPFVGVFCLGLIGWADWPAVPVDVLLATPLILES